MTWSDRPRRGAPMPAAASRARRLRSVPFVVALSALGAALAGCGGSPQGAGVAHLGTSTTVAPAAATTVPAVAAGPGPGGNGGAASQRSKQDLGGQLLVYGQCMRAHGVPNFPEPTASATPGDVRIKVVVPAGEAATPKFKAAARACQKFAPTGPALPQITTLDQADYLKAAECMRAHGIVGFPDPVFSGGGVHFPLPRGMDANSAQFRRAREICELLIPAGLPYSKQAEGGQ